MFEPASCCLQRCRNHSPALRAAGVALAGNPLVAVLTPANVDIPDSLEVSAFEDVQVCARQDRLLAASCRVSPPWTALSHLFIVIQSPNVAELALLSISTHPGPARSILTHPSPVSASISTVLVVSQCVKTAHITC